MDSIKAAAICLTIVVIPTLLVVGFILLAFKLGG